MAVLHRITVDVVCEEELSDRRLATIAAQASEYVHLLGTETDDEVIMVTDKYAEAHVHDSTDDRCRTCRYHSADDKNGDSVS